MGRWLKYVATASIAFVVMCDSGNDPQPAVNNQPISLRIVQPVGNEIYTVGETLKTIIQCELKDNYKVNLKLLLNNNKNSFTLLNSPIDLQTKSNRTDTAIFIIPDSVVTDEGKKISIASNITYVKAFLINEENRFSKNSIPFSIINQAPQGSVDYGIRVVSPNGGESFTIGDTMNITLKCDTTEDFRAAVFLSVDNGINYYSLFQDETVWLDTIKSRTATVQWAIPESLTYDNGTKASTVSSKCRIKIYDYIDDEKIDISDNVFSITK